MNEDSGVGAVVSMTVDGETVPVTDGVTVDPSMHRIDEAGIRSILTPQTIEGTVKIVRNVHASMCKLFSNAFDVILITYGGMLRPQWLYYCRHGKRVKTRRKYRKMLKRLARKTMKSWRK